MLWSFGSPIQNHDHNKKDGHKDHDSNYSAYNDRLGNFLWNFRRNFRREGLHCTFIRVRIFTWNDGTIQEYSHGSYLNKMNRAA